MTVQDFGVCKRGTAIRHRAARFIAMARVALRVALAVVAALAGLAGLAASALAKPYTFVALHDQGRVAVYDHGTASWTGSVLVGGGPLAIAPTANQRFALVGNYLAHTLSVLSVANRNLITTIPLNGAPHGIVAPAGTYRAYVSLFDQNAVAVVDLASMTAAGAIVVGAQPSGIAASDNGDRVFVANTDDNTVSVISTASNTVQATITLPVASRPFALAFLRDGADTRLLVGGNRDGRVQVLDGAAPYSVLGTLAVGSNPTAFAPVSSRKVYVTHSFDGSVSVLDPFLLSASALPKLPSPAPAAGTAGGGFAALLSAPDQLTVMDATTNATAPPITIPGAPKAPLSMASFVLNPAYECALDLNGDGTFDGQDSAVLLRHLAGVRANALTIGLPSMNGNLVASIVAGLSLDADGDGVARATTDGLLLDRISRGVIGPALVSNARNSTFPGIRGSTQTLDWLASTHGVNCVP